MAGNKDNPNYSYAPSTVFPTGRKTGGTSHHIDAAGVGSDLSLVVGRNPATDLVESVDVNNNALTTMESGFYPYTVTYIYYVRNVDYSLFKGPDRLYVEDSIGRHKKLVVFKQGALPTDLAQVTTLYYQITNFPTKITGIQTYYDPVSVYLDAGNSPCYDPNDAAQQSIYPN